MTQHRYYAFISYSHRDDGWASWLHKRLEAYRPPRRLVGTTSAAGPVPRKLAPVFRDRDELPTATDLGSKISEALAHSACQIVICSPDSARSKWVNEEILAYKRLGREDRIFCLIVGGEPNASDRPELGLEECFPEALRYRLNADGTLSDERTEPIAADARPGKDGKSNALLKLIAGMLGVGFDALRQRELHRRQRRLMAIASAATLGMFVTSGLATVALFARAEAERQAETATRTANFIKELFRVSDPSEARGNSMLAREVLDRGARRLETELDDEPEIQASLLDTIGTVYTGLGLWNEAMPLLETALERRRTYLGPGHPDAASTQANLGNLLRLRAEFDASELQYRAAIETQRKALGDDDPAVAASLAGFAETLAEVGRFDEAEAALREALAIRRAALGEDHPDVGLALEDLALVIGSRGDLDTATAMMEEALEIQRRAWGDEPHVYLAEALNNAGYLSYARGDYETTETLFREALAMNRKLLGEHHGELATSINNLALILHDQDEFAQAEAMYREALEIMAATGGIDTPDYANTLNNLAYVQYDQGDVPGALESARTALAIYDRNFPDGHPDSADTLAGIGAWLLELGELTEAEEVIRKGLTMREAQLGPDHPAFANSRVQLAMLFVTGRRFDEALELARAAQATLAASLPPEHWRIASATAVEGAALSGKALFGDAEPLLLESLSRLENDPGALPVYVREARRYLYELYVAWGRPGDAEAYLPTITAAVAR